MASAQAAWQPGPLTSLGSPLGSYASLDLSEPLQSAALTLAVARALAISQPNVTKRAALRCAFLAGLAAGVAILTKSSLWVAAPFALLPLLRADAPVGLRARILCALGGLAVPVGGWIHFEIRGSDVCSRPTVARASRIPGWMDSGDCSPVRIGVWFYLSRARHRDSGGGDLYRRPSNRARLVVTASAGIFAALLAIGAGWWAWHGLWGWGPRLLVPAIPPLAACAAIVVDRWPRTARYALLAASTILNLPGLLQNAAPVTLFAAACQWPTADKAFAESLASYVRHVEPDGNYRVAPDQVLETVPRRSFSISRLPVVPRDPHRNNARRRERACSKHLPGSSRGPHQLHERRDERPGTAPVRPSGWAVWGRGFWPDPDGSGFPGVYDEGLLDAGRKSAATGSRRDGAHLVPQAGAAGPSR